MKVKATARNILQAAIVLIASVGVVGVVALQAQQPPAGGAGAPAGGAARGGGGRGGGPVLSVTTSAWPDGAEIPAKHISTTRGGENKSPAFEFHWTAMNNPADAPANLQSYAVVFHDIENASARGTTDTLHWTIFNVPGTAKGMAEGLGAGDLPDGSRNGPGINARGGNPGSYFGPGAGVGPFHHYVFEFYALDTKLDLPGTATRDELMKAMEGHVIGKAAYVGRYRATQ
ncbi:MAG TPA: YbhB/YbcL family Raf kinase inhibitor-like protein [Vicinamibacterales bacterium]|jgi:Raf kinase inhibitor-like YbhB/YbcL family protein|nr:YbhB/YbcL family Raf kinase inhibitor-like protein [Vicinamibacterales bacterium]